ncbi:MAG: (2Fe-2S) ferredoxin domain-containing protein [Lachnospiraceae bacterium]|nr:(2Fe-2S) ferredoxin domain-containing protein [Lachnospiraceae bacterium]MBR6271859.1 (2Fe-2S) ferredoxin domain-containing protein [Lachnospiraceae bacterium]
MKTLAELQAIREKMKDSVIMRSGSGNVRAVVGMATCGIAAGARPVLSALVEEVNTLGISDKVTVTQTGCIGICRYEPVVEVFEADKEKVTYVKMTPEKARRVAEEHLKNGKVVEEYTIGAVEK